MTIESQVKQILSIVAAQSEILTANTAALSKMATAMGNNGAADMSGFQETLDKIVGGQEKLTAAVTDVQAQVDDPDAGPAPSPAPAPDPSPAPSPEPAPAPAAA